MRIGIFGGSFDPIHWGHLVLAEEARLTAGLDLILLVPAGRPPHKLNVALTPFAHRLAMTRLAVAGLAGFAVSDVEGEGPGPHYAWEVVERLAASHPADELAYLLGSDSLLELASWRHPERILERCRLVVLPRPGFDAGAAPAELLAGATLVTGVQVALSSTLIRQRLGRGAEARFLVPGPVREYVRRHGLYGGG